MSSKQAIIILKLDEACFFHYGHYARLQNDQKDWGTQRQFFENICS